MRRSLTPLPTATTPQLTGDPTLEFVEAPALPPPEALLSAEQIAQQEAELAQASAMPLPADDDDDEL